MFVKERMSRPALTVHPEMPIWDAHRLMRKENVRRFPVVDKRGRLVGIISEKDLLNAAPSQATSLSMHEINYLLSRITVEKVMTKKVITVEEGTPLEDAARIMADLKIGGLPVTRDGEVVGIITETDLFKIFLELLGAREQGLRLSILIHNQPGELANVTKAIFDIGGNIIALGTFLGETSKNREVVIRVEDVDLDALEEAVRPIVARIVDIRQPE